MVKKHEEELLSNEVEGTNEPMLTKTYLNDEELEHFRQLLMKRRDEVMRDLDILRSSLSDANVEESVNSNYSLHMADHGTDTMDREQRFMFIARDEKYITYIDQALDRIRNKTYGICLKSGKPIPKKRLEAVPHTSVRIEFKQGKK
jgi:RNA polymerase-binding protein DksA